MSSIPARRETFGAALLAGVLAMSCAGQVTAQTRQFFPTPSSPTRPYKTYSCLVKTCYYLKSPVSGGFGNYQECAYSGSGGAGASCGCYSSGHGHPGTVRVKNACGPGPVVR